MNQKMTNEMDELRSDLNKVREDLRKMADSVIGRGREQANKAQHQMRSGWDQSVEVMQKQVEERPVTTMVGAFVVGIVLGRLLGK